MMLKTVKYEDFTEIHNTEVYNINTLRLHIDNAPIDASFVIVFRDDKPAGIMVYSEYGTVILVHTVYVRYHHRRCGCAIELFEAINQEKSTSLDVRLDNKAAIKLYKKLGFEQEIMTMVRCNE